MHLWLVVSNIFGMCTLLYSPPSLGEMESNLTNVHIIVQMGWWKTTNYINSRIWVFGVCGQVPYKGRTLSKDELNLQIHSWLQRGVIDARICRLWPGLQTANGLGSGGLHSWDPLVKDCYSGAPLESQTTKPNHQVTIDWFAAFGKNNFSETFFWDCELLFLRIIVQIGEWVPPRQASLKSWSRWWWKSSQYFNQLMNFLDCYCWKKSVVRYGTYPIVLTSFYVSTGTPNKQS